jgi:hypothetical protein
MARSLRFEFLGAIYHVTGRMVGSWRDERLRLFRDPKDYQGFLERLGEGVDELGVRVYLFLPDGQSLPFEDSRMGSGRYVLFGTKDILL